MISEFKIIRGNGANHKCRYCDNRAVFYVPIWKLEKGELYHTTLKVCKDHLLFLSNQKGRILIEEINGISMFQD